MFSSLPLELLRKIGNETARLKDRKSLRRTCSLFGEAFKPHALAEVTLNIHKDNLEPGLTLLKVLADEKASELEETTKQEQFKYTHDTEQVKSWVESGGVQSKLAEEQLRELLEPALKSLRRLDTVRWHWHRQKQNNWTLNTVLAVISAPEICHNIREFSFQCDWEYSILFNFYIPDTRNIPISLPKLPKLQILSISANVSDSVFEAITKQPIILTTSLTPLNLCSEGLYWAHIPPHIMLDNVIAPTMSNLGLSGLVTEVPRHILRNLTSLNLSRTHNRDPWDAVWITLALEQIRLRSLVISHYHHNVDAILDYIQSYSGLEILSLISPAWYDPTYNDAADRFYKDVLPMHEQSLVKLEVKPVFESRWCFGEHNIEAFRRCTKLRSLWVRVDHKGLEIDPNSDVSYWYNQPSTNPNAVHILLDMISFALLDLEKVIIEPARDPGLAYDHEDFLLGPRLCLTARRRIYASVKSFVSSGSVSTGVLNWVKVFVWNDRVVIASPTDDGHGETEKEEGKKERV
ncbi:hypothetical protein BT96DRAFT_1020528 [Gymnopus androsaceus JB14]|uniref:F-box domain-containing protein n=1 Tax=Gymnopus androsaceus JB14 TaxID=1447944 RepID=A0A6A4HH71_9AGAR|nr:hypothetical protein BT96DRAFT_1020528 [Gymnopus androsaceus JB14]